MKHTGNVKHLLVSWGTQQKRSGMDPDSVIQILVLLMLSDYGTGIYRLVVSHLGGKALGGKVRLMANAVGAIITKIMKT